MLRARPCSVVLMRTYMVFFRGVVQGDMLADEYSDANPAEVEAVQELVNLRQLVQAQLRANKSITRFSSAFHRVGQSLYFTVGKGYSRGP